MVFKEPKGLEKPSDIQFNEFTTWIQCHNLLLAYMNPDTIRRIGEVVGKVEEIDSGEGGNCIGQYARIRVTRAISKPLQRCVRIIAEGGTTSQTVLIRYERLPEFCQACGRVCHTTRSCEDPTVDKSKKPFGPWLKATRTREYRRGNGTHPPDDGHGTTSPRTRRSRSPENSSTGYREIVLKEGSKNNQGTTKNIIVTVNEPDGTMDVDPQLYWDKPAIEGENTGESTKDKATDGTTGEEMNSKIPMGTEERKSTDIPRKRSASSSPLKRKKKVETKGWKRRARDQNKTKSSNSQQLEEPAENERIGEKRRGAEETEEDGNHKKRMLCYREASWTHNDPTAEAAEQPRRQP